ncbi:hypothetical protein Aple_065990 [Acrocarpospora pleiomorpha]|uniref:Transposase InsH N-terminal domain-containing protein n=1 Tax=Acrocarpospora pleiomorpha TaxID=90975 RepID=A0A5M3XSD3_9ACTN|nr:hypothetical protein Aple_065990 [Acrocarpospora pleiomorpha]
MLQALHGLSDEEAVAALRFDLRWKAACGLGLYERGFDPSLLTYFRRRLPLFASGPDLPDPPGGDRADRGAGRPDPAGAGLGRAP